MAWVSYLASQGSCLQRQQWWRSEDEDKTENIDLMILDDIQQLRRILDGLIALSDNCEIFFNSQTEQIENGAIITSNV